VPQVSEGRGPQGRSAKQGILARTRFFAPAVHTCSRTLFTQITTSQAGFESCSYGGAGAGMCVTLSFFFIWRGDCALERCPSRKGPSPWRSGR
jgi:hypothetical protein